MQYPQFPSFHYPVILIDLIIVRKAQAQDSGPADVSLRPTNLIARNFVTTVPAVQMATAPRPEVIRVDLTPETMETSQKRTGQVNQPIAEIRPFMFQEMRVERPIFMLEKVKRGQNEQPTPRTDLPRKSTFYFDQLLI